MLGFASSTPTYKNNGLLSYAGGGVAAIRQKVENRKGVAEVIAFVKQTKQPTPFATFARGANYRFRFLALDSFENANVLEGVG